MKPLKLLDTPDQVIIQSQLPRTKDAGKERIPNNRQLSGGLSKFEVNKVMMHLKQQPDMSIRHGINIPIDHHCYQLL